MDRETMKNMGFQGIGHWSLLMTREKGARWKQAAISLIDEAPRFHHSTESLWK